MASPAEILAQKLAGYDLDENTLRAALAKKQNQSVLDRLKALTYGGEVDSGRGLLQSSIGLGTQRNTNIDWNNYDSGLTTGFDTDLANLARQRLGARNDYDAATEAQARAEAEAAAKAAEDRARKQAEIDAQTTQNNVDYSLLTPVAPVPSYGAPNSITKPKPKPTTIGTGLGTPKGQNHPRVQRPTQIARY